MEVSKETQTGFFPCSGETAGNLRYLGHPNRWISIRERDRGCSSKKETEKEREQQK